MYGSISYIRYQFCLHLLVEQSSPPPPRMELRNQKMGCNLNLQRLFQKYSCLRLRSLRKLKIGYILYLQCLFQNTYVALLMLCCTLWQLLFFLFCNYILYRYWIFFPQGNCFFFLDCYHASSVAIFIMQCNVMFVKAHADISFSYHGQLFSSNGFINIYFHVLKKIFMKNSYSWVFTVNHLCIIW